VAVLENTDTAPPCYLLEQGDDYAALPASLEGKVLGSLPPDPGYKDMLGALHEAELFSSYKRPLRDDYSSELFRSLVGNSRDIQFVRKLIRQVAITEASVLILGESGTGKELVAHNIHRYSKRREKPFVPVNCGAIPAELLESELFGHEKGAFTGAYSARQGRFELAEGGTLFLDEIGDMPLNMQVKLLRVLQERTFERVGSSTTLQANVRIIAATHQNLEQLATEGKFRMDLYYRLNVFPIEVPPLRKRVEDIPLLVKVFNNQMELEKRGAVRLNDCAQAALAKYYWPGNVRELSNLIERLAILHPQKLIRWSDLPEKFRPNQDWIAEQLEESPQQQLPLSTGPSPNRLPDAGIDLKAHLADIECGLIAQALEQSDWVVARAAKLLDLQRTTLVEKMRKYDISRPLEVPEF
jgi:sigma-54 specific flagellar transcriptional regulator A